MLTRVDYSDEVYPVSSTLNVAFTDLRSVTNRFLILDEEDLDLVIGLLTINELRPSIRSLYIRHDVDKIALTMTQRTSVYYFNTTSPIMSPDSFSSIILYTLPAKGDEVTLLIKTKEKEQIVFNRLKQEYVLCL